MISLIPETNRKELSRLLKIAGPLALYYLTEVAMGVTNMVIVGRLGSEELAAVGLAAGMQIEFILVCFGILSMVSVLSSQSLGENNHKQVTTIVSQGFWVAGVLSLVAIVFGLNIPAIFELTGQDPEVIRLASDYVIWMAWFSPFALGFVVLRNFLVVISKPQVVLYFTIPALGLNLFINYALVLGKFGLPELGVAGAGIGTTLVNCLMFLGLFSYVSVNTECRHYHLFRSIRDFDYKVCKMIVSLGAPAGISVFLEGGLFVVVGILMGTFGSDWLAANEILFHLISITFVIAVAIGEAASVRIAFNVGAANLKMVQWNALVAVVLGAIVMLFSASILWNIPHLIIALFIDLELPENAQMINIAVSLTAIAAVFQFFDGLQAVSSWALRGLKDTLIPMWIATCGYWLCGLGGGYMAAFVFNYGAEGIWWGMAAGLTVAGILLSTRLYLMMRTDQLASRFNKEF